MQHSSKRKKVIVANEKISPFCEWDGHTLMLNILGTPSAKKTAIGKAKGNQLKISVNAQPENGKATDCLVKFLAKEFGVPTRDIEVVKGRMNINKLLRIHSPTKWPDVICQSFSNKPTT